MVRVIRGIIITFERFQASIIYCKNILHLLLVLHSLLWTHIVYLNISAFINSKIQFLSELSIYFLSNSRQYQENDSRMNLS